MDNEPGAGKRPLKRDTGSLDAVKGRTETENRGPWRGAEMDPAKRDPQGCGAERRRRSQQRSRAGYASREAGASNHPPQPWPRGAGSHRPTAPLRHGLGQLLRDQPQLPSRGGTGGLDPAKSAIVLLEAMEAAADAAPSLDPTRGRPRRGAHGDAQPQRLLADERQPHCATSADQPAPEGTRCPDLRALWLELHYEPNARV